MNCKFSITQFEFELSSENEIENDNLDYLQQINHHKSEDVSSNVVEQVDENKENKVKVRAWERNLALFQKGERSNTIYTWINRNRHLYKSNKIPKEKLDILMSINFPFESKRKRGKNVKNVKNVKDEKGEKGEQPQNLINEKPKRKSKTWERNLELFKKGEKSNSVYTWISRNRKMFHANKLSKEQLKKLEEANFLFEVQPKEEQINNWEKQFRLWKNGNRNPSLQIWRETSVKRFVAGKLSQDRVAKLKEVGILK